MSKMKEYAVVYYHGKTHYLGRYGTPEALTAYNRLCAEIQANPVFQKATHFVPLPCKFDSIDLFSNLKIGKIAKALPAFRVVIACLGEIG